MESSTEDELPDFDIDLYLKGGKFAARAISRLGAYGGRLWLSPRKWTYAEEPLRIHKTKKPWVTDEP